MACACARWAACACTTPLGAPVVPDVYKKVKASGGGCSSAAGLVAAGPDTGSICPFSELGPCSEGAPLKGEAVGSSTVHAMLMGTGRRPAHSLWSVAELEAPPLASTAALKSPWPRGSKTAISAPLSASASAASWGDFPGLALCPSQKDGNGFVFKNSKSP